MLCQNTILFLLWLKRPKLNRAYQYLSGHTCNIKFFLKQMKFSMLSNFPDPRSYSLLPLTENHLTNYKKPIRLSKGSLALEMSLTISYSDTKVRLPKILNARLRIPPIMWQLFCAHPAQLVCPRECN